MRSSLALKFVPLTALLALPTLAQAEESAAARLEAMAKFLAGVKQVTVSADCSYDVVQPTGEKIELGERRTLILRRPDRARVHVTGRDGKQSGIVFDGTQVTIFNVDEKVYAKVPQRGSIDEALASYSSELHRRLPLRELFAADLLARLKPDLASARLVDEETVGGALTDHIALRHQRVDIQIWIARSGEPLPQRIVITYREAAGQPQFAANFSEWNFPAEMPDSLFTHVPADDAHQIAVVTPRPSKKAKGKKP